jgi:transcriptional regulator with XRE-family HTH domain
MGQIKNKNHDKAVGSRISEMRQKAGFKSLIDFAERYDFDYQTLRSIESGHLTINTATLKWFAETLKVSSDYLLGLTDIQTPDVKEREIIDKYGLDAPSLETLSGLADHDESYRARPGWDRPLKALNAILLEETLCDTILDVVYDIVFNDPNDMTMEFEVIVTKSGRRYNNQFLYHEVYGELQLMVLRRFFYDLRKELERYNLRQDAIKAKNT